MVFDYDIKPGLRFVPKKSTDIDLDVSSAYCRSQTMITLYELDSFSCPHEKLSCNVWTPNRHLIVHPVLHSFTPLQKSHRNHRSKVAVNTSPIRYGFHAGAKGIRYGASINLIKPGEDKNVACVTCTETPNSLYWRHQWSKRYVGRRLQRRQIETSRWLLRWLSYLERKRLNEAIINYMSPNFFLIFIHCICTELLERKGSLCMTENVQ